MNLQKWDVLYNKKTKNLDNYTDSLGIIQQIDFETIFLFSLQHHTNIFKTKDWKKVQIMVKRIIK